jgi:uncharacterized protein with FMN-binding domain
MRRIIIWLMSTLTALVLLFSYRTSLGNASGGEAAADADPATTGRTTYEGSTAQTRWGPVQVTITVNAGRIVGVSVPTYPDGNGRDREINAYALPILKKATIAAQSADIDTVSGATITSEGYLESLQAAIDAAHLSS